MAHAVRAPAVAGRFYPDDPRELRREVSHFLGDGTSAQPALGVLAPHAGYVFSGAVAGHTFTSVRVPERVVVLCPNHTGRGAPISVFAKGAFRIPGADIPIEEDLAQAVLAEVPGAQEDARAHVQEHAIEVELPFLLALQPRLRLVPVVLGGLTEQEALDVGRALARVVAGLSPSDVLVVASSDMSHYLPDPDARRQDRLAMGPLLSLDAQGLIRTVETHDISMCGYLPTAAMLAYAKARGATECTLSAYATSGDAFGDYSRVVGYAGAVVR
jgi:AmmeMemoRadiSam system protein B